MAGEKLFIDKTELVAGFIRGKKFVTANLTCENIISVSIEPCKTGLFKNKPDERIVIASGKLNEPIIYYRHTEKKFFDSYAKDIEKFCKDNNISFRKNVE
ncbi:MAG: hypothetical protein FWD78_08515 [Treponema sp.]|nr:hypothetical protein [Treponema sp.]